MNEEILNAQLAVLVAQQELSDKQYLLQKAMNEFNAARISDQLAKIAASKLASGDVK